MQGKTWVKVWSKWILAWKAELLSKKAVHVSTGVEAGEVPSVDEAKRIIVWKKVCMALINFVLILSVLRSSARLFRRWRTDV